MGSLLRIDCSPRPSQSFSTRFADIATPLLKAHFGCREIVHRRLAETPPPFVDEAFTEDMRLYQTAEAASARGALAASEALIRELEAADVLLVATPMHNFTVPAVLKAWLDQVARNGRTFVSTENGKVGLLADRPAVVIVSSGSYYRSPRARQPDFLTPYVASIFATVGIRDVTFLPLEGLARGPDAVDVALSDARSCLEGRLRSLTP